MKRPFMSEAPAPTAHYACGVHLAKYARSTLNSWCYMKLIGRRTGYERPQVVIVEKDKPVYYGGNYNGRSWWMQKEELELKKWDSHLKERETIVKERELRLKEENALGGRLLIVGRTIFAMLVLFLLFLILVMYRA